MRRIAESAVATFPNNQFAHNLWIYYLGKYRQTIENCLIDLICGQLIVGSLISWVTPKFRGLFNKH